MATYVNDGSTIPYTPVSAATAGDVVVQGLMIGIVVADIEAGQLGALRVDGAFQFTTAATFDVGDMAFYNSSTDTITSTDTDVYAGRVVEQPTATTVNVKINFLSEALGS
jgi:predicted RecA/RadA family phage recombinase